MRFFIFYGDDDFNHLCCSVVEYATYDDMKNAMKKLDASELNGRKIKLIEDYRGSRHRRYANFLLKSLQYVFTNILISLC